MPLSQIKGGLADGNAEAYNRAKIRYLEKGFTQWTGVGAAPARDPDIYLIAFWELYDYAAVYKSALHLLEPADAPGIAKNEDSSHIFGDSIKQHLIAMQAAYPTAFDAIQAGSAPSIKYVLNKVGIRDEYCPAILERMRGK